MATNEYLARGEEFTLPAPQAANGGLGPIANDPIIWGLTDSPSKAVALNTETSYTPPGSLVPTGNCTFKRIGGFFYTVQAKTAIGGGSKAINSGDAIYADGGTQDVATGMLYGITLNANNGTGWFFGHAMAGLGAGLTGVIPVLIGAK